LDDRRRDGGTNSTLRTKEQGKPLTLNEHDDDDDDHKNQPATCHRASFAFRICCCFYSSIFMHAIRFWSLRYIQLNPNMYLVSISSFLFIQQQNGCCREDFFTLFPIDSFFTLIFLFVCCSVIGG